MTTKEEFKKKQLEVFNKIVEKNIAIVAQIDQDHLKVEQKGKLINIRLIPNTIKQSFNKFS